MRIRQLPLLIANQIAAGEVVERPASVVKELLENSLDAGATAITIEIAYGGLNQIKVSDNGSGIVADDLPLSIAPHATSKITLLEDLYRVRSMGFRGEALASIASVAKLTISSKTAEQEHAMMLKAQDSEFVIIPCARTVGTTVDVCDLFYNAPVRKRFLKNEKLEFQAIEGVIKRFALSAPHILLTLYHNNKLAISLPAAVNEQSKVARMAKLFGHSFLKEAIHLEFERGGMSLSGWISSPNLQRSQNDKQWVYVNQRMVKDKLINHALKQAYDGLMHPGRFPVCLLYFSLDHGEVDVNVHPTKHELRFQHPRLVHDFFTSSLTKALNSQSKEKEIHIKEQAAVYTPVLKPINYELAIIKEPSSWIILNHQFALIFVNNRPHLINVLSLYREWLYSQLSDEQLPLKSRPLLVPISYHKPDNVQLDKIKNCCDLLGLHFELKDEDNLLFQRVPVKAPYLDLQSFLSAINQASEINVEQLIKLITQNQFVDVTLLNKEEKSELSHYFISQQNSNAVACIGKALTIDDCRLLLDV